MRPTLVENRQSMQRARASLALWPHRALSGAEKALLIHGGKTLTASLLICPIDTGALRATARLLPVVRRPGRVEVVLAYGGTPGTGATAPTSSPHVSKRGHVYQRTGGVDYAIYVHEDLEAKHVPPTQAKFLEVPALEMAPRIPAAVAAGIDAELMA